MDEKYLNFELPAYLYFNSAHIAVAPKLKYMGKNVSGGWYGKFFFDKPSIVKVPVDSWLISGNYFLDLILKNDSKFTKYLFDLNKKLILFSNKLQKMNSQDLSKNKVTDIKKFIKEYKETFCSVIAISYPIDTALDEYIKKNNINSSNPVSYGNSFSLVENNELYKISKIKDSKKRLNALKKHSLNYSWINNNYSGEHRVDLDYFAKRISSVKKQDILNKIKKSPPKSISEWIGFLTYLRDSRKKLNLIANGMLDRYLKEQCNTLKIDYTFAVMLSFEEFEEQKKKGVFVKYSNPRIIRTDEFGVHNLSEKEWDFLFDENLNEVNNITGFVASKGIARGIVKVVLQQSDFSKVNKGDILVVSMTRPEFMPLMEKAVAIVTNEGGVTSHAAIISRELNKPCIIGTKVATKVLHDGDLVEVNANSGIVRIIEKIKK